MYSLLDNFAITVQVHSHTLVVASTVYGFMGVLVLVYCRVPYCSLQWRMCTSTSEELPWLQGTQINPRIAQELCYDFADGYKLPYIRKSTRHPARVQFALSLGLRVAIWLRKARKMIGLQELDGSCVSPPMEPDVLTWEDKTKCQGHVWW